MLRNPIIRIVLDAVVLVRFDLIRSKIHSMADLPNRIIIGIQGYAGELWICSKAYSWKRKF